MPISSEREISHGRQLHWWVALLLALLFVGLYYTSLPKTMPGTVLVDRAEASLLDGAMAQAKPVSLPHIQDDETGSWQQNRVRYSIRWPQDMQYPENGGVAMLLPRVGTRFRVWLNGHQIAHVGWNEPEDRVILSAWFPQLIQFPPDFLKAQAEENRIEIDVHPQLLERSGLGIVHIGDERVLYDRFLTLNNWQITGTWMMVWISAAMVAMSLLMRNTFKEGIYTIMAVCAAANLIRNLLSVLIEPGMPFDWYFYLHRVSFTVYCGTLFLFINRFFAIHLPLARWLALFLLSVGPVWLLYTLIEQEYDYYRIWAGLIAIIGFVSFGELAWQAWKKKRSGSDLRPDQKLMVVVALFTLATGIRDFLVVQLNFPGDADLRWMSPGSATLMIAFLWSLYKKASISYENEKANRAILAAALDQKEAELRDAFELIKAKERVEAAKTASEKVRREVIRNLHDGVGSQLIQIKNTVEQTPQIEYGKIAPMLQTAIQDLRLHLDSMEPMGGDLAAIMGSFRQRLIQPLSLNGIKVQWDIEEVHRLDYFNSQTVMNLYRSLQEITTNILKHSGATTLRVRTHEDEDHVYLTLEDNGKGLSEAQLRGEHQRTEEGGRGLTNLRVRARSMGAELNLSNTHPGLRMQFSFFKTMPNFESSTVLEQKT